MPRAESQNEAFVRTFLLPLIKGGEVRVGRPLGAPEVRALEAEAVTASDLLLEVENARQLRAAALWLHPVPLSWDPTAARLAVAAHNVLFLGHPDAEQWLIGRNRLDRVARFTGELLKMLPPRSGAEAVARHTMVGGLLELEREDVVLDTWLMVYSFRGQQPPRNLRRFPGLRRVRESRTRLRWVADERLRPVQLELVAKLLRVSPLTDLLSPQRPRPPFSFAETAGYLRWPLLSRLVCQRYLEMGLQQVGAPMCTAFWEMVAAPPADAGAPVRRVLGLLLFLCAAGSVGNAAVTMAASGEPLGQLGTVAVVAAECGLLPGGLDPPVDERLKKLCAEARHSVGNKTINELAGRLRAALE